MSDAEVEEQVPIVETTVADVRAEASQLATQVGGPIRRVSVRHGDIAVELEWDRQITPVAETPAVASGIAVAPAAPVDAPTAEDERSLVLSPIVGTFYHAPAPEKPSYVAVGDTVAADQVIGIVEAMKLMNPIVAEVGGTVDEICTGNGEPVEFGDRLIAIVPEG